MLFSSVGFFLLLNAIWFFFAFSLALSAFLWFFNLPLILLRLGGVFVFFCLLTLLSPVILAWQAWLWVIYLISLFIGFSLFFPLRYIFSVILSFFFGLGLLCKFSWQKINYYSSRYFISSLSLLYNELDLFWIEIMRDYYYPNDNRYYRIYRRWVNWVNPRPWGDPDDETYEYFYIFLWGYLCRYFIIFLRLGFFRCLRHFHNFLRSFGLSNLGYGLVFFLLCFFFFFCRWLPQQLHAVVWTGGLFVYRQMYYLTGNFLVLDILEMFNSNWAEVEVRGNVDEFEDPLYVFAKHPSTFIIKCFYYFLPSNHSLNSDGLHFLKVFTPMFYSPWRLGHLILVGFSWLFQGLFSFLFQALTVLAVSFFNVYFFFYRKNFLQQRLWLLSSSYKCFFTLVFNRVLLLFYSFCLPFFLLVGEASGRMAANVFFGLAGSFYYFFVVASRLASLVPFSFLLIFRLGFYFLARVRPLLLVGFLFLIFTKEHLSFFYFFSLGWFLDLALAFLDTFSLALNDYYPMWCGPGYLDFNVLFWVRKFSRALSLYRGHILSNIEDIVRVRAMWEVILQRWKTWLFFIRFMPFYSQTSMVKKWWYESAHTALYTPAMFWWCYSNFDRLFRFCSGFTLLLKVFIIYPYGIYQSLYYHGYWMAPRLYDHLVSFYGFLSFCLGRFTNVVGAFYSFLKNTFNITNNFVLIWSRTLKLWLSLVDYLCYFISTCFFKPSVLYIAYVYLCGDELLAYIWYVFKCYWWGAMLVAGDVKHVIFSSGSALVLKWMRFYFVYGFLFNYLNYNLNNFYEWWISHPVAAIQGRFPSATHVLSLLAARALQGSPASYHLAFWLRLEQWLDTLCLNLQLPRDAQKNAYAYVAKKVINVRFLLWIMPLRRTQMYSTSRWLMPIYVYFQILQTIQLSGEPAFNFPGVVDTHEMRIYSPALYYGFIWNGYAIYFLSLAILVILSGQFTSLLFYQGPKSFERNREYAWRRFREEHPRNLPWLFFDIDKTLLFYEHVATSNELSSKFYYYEKLLKHVSTSRSAEKIMSYFYSSSLMDCERFKIYEDTVCISPTFFDFYLHGRYGSFRSTIHKGDDAFTYFSSYAFSLNQWINSVWQSPDSEDYTPIAEEVVFHEYDRQQFMRFYDRVFTLQRDLDRWVFFERLSPWIFAKEPLNMRILETDFKDSFSEADYALDVPILYEYEDNEEGVYLPWGVYAWLFAVPFVLFYKSFFFLGGSHWHYNRASPGIMQNFMLYFMGVFYHFEFINYFRMLTGDGFYFWKREGGARSFVLNYHYRSHARNVIKQYFYNYKLPYKGINGAGINFTLWRLFYFKLQPLTSSPLNELRFLNYITFGLLALCLPVILRKQTHLRGGFYSLNYLASKVSLLRNFSLAKNLKRAYVWLQR